MAQIEVTPADLLSTSYAIDGCLPVGDDVANRSGALKADAAAAGRADVIGAIGSFLDVWAYGMSVVNQDARALSQLLRSAGEAYGQAESDISGAAGA